VAICTIVSRRQAKSYRSEMRNKQISRHTLMLEIYVTCMES